MKPILLILTIIVVAVLTAIPLMPDLLHAVEGPQQFDPAGDYPQYIHIATDLDRLNVVKYGTDKYIAPSVDYDQLLVITTDSQLRTADFVGKVIRLNDFPEKDALLKTINAPVGVPGESTVSGVNEVLAGMTTKDFNSDTLILIEGNYRNVLAEYIFIVGFISLVLLTVFRKSVFVLS